MSEQEARKSFWATLPGMLSALAGILGAIAAIVGAVTSLGIFGGGSDDKHAARASFPLDSVRLTYSVRVTGDATRFTILRVGPIPARTQIALHCRGGGCFAGTRQRAVTDSAPSVSLLHLVPELRRGATLEVRFTGPNAGLKVWTFVVRRAALPAFTTACQPKGAQLLEAC